METERRITKDRGRERDRVKVAMLQRWSTKG